MGSSLKGKTYEEIYGKENAEQQKIKRGLAIKKWHTSVGFDYTTIQKMKAKQKELWETGFYSNQERSTKISNFMKNNNPMKNPEIAKKNANKRRGVKKPQYCGEGNPAFKGVFHKKCQNCDADIVGSKWMVENRKFCSSHCRHEFYRGENHPSKRADVKEKQRKARLRQIGELGGDLQLGRNEKKILDELENIIGYEISRNFQIIGYKPDGYIKELNLIIEVDEKHHFTKDGRYIKKDVIRQNLIKNELSCEFLRIKDDGNVNHSILTELSKQIL